jgi:hypothetical protein
MRSIQDAWCLPARKETDITRYPRHWHQLLFALLMVLGKTGVRGVISGPLAAEAAAHEAVLARATIHGQLNLLDDSNESLLTQLVSTSQGRKTRWGTNGPPQRIASADHLPNGGTADPLMALPAELLGLVGVPHTRAGDDPPLDANQPAVFLNECAKAWVGLTCRDLGQLGWLACRTEEGKPLSALG